MIETEAYKPSAAVRIVTAASLFDGHDAAINIMRRILQATGAEVIHLGHNRSVADIVRCAIQEDAQAVAITSYQGGHVEYFKYMHDLLREYGAGHIKIFGGGGGTILPGEIEELHAYGIDRIYSPDDGRSMGLQGMINDLMRKSDAPTPQSWSGRWREGFEQQSTTAIAQAITALENSSAEAETILATAAEILEGRGANIPVLGITGTGGAGKSSLTDELVRRFVEDFPTKKVGVLSVDPSKRKTGGALLGDRIRMNAAANEAVYMRSFATRQANIALNPHVAKAIQILKAAGYDLVIVETAGIGQSDSEITAVADVALYVMTPEYGAASQLEKIDMIDYADFIALNKFDKRGALDALRDVRKQYQRSRGLWHASPDTMPVFGTMASQFNDPGTNTLYRSLIDAMNDKFALGWQSSIDKTDEMSKKQYIIPPDRVRYLSEITDEIRRYNKRTKEQAEIASKLGALRSATAQLDR